MKCIIQEIKFLSQTLIFNFLIFGIWNYGFYQIKQLIKFELSKVCTFRQVAKIQGLDLNLWQKLIFFWFILRRQKMYCLFLDGRTRRCTVQFLSLVWQYRKQITEIDTSPQFRVNLFSNVRSLPSPTIVRNEKKSDTE